MFFFLNFKTRFRLLFITVLDATMEVHSRTVRIINKQSRPLIRLRIYFPKKNTRKREYILLLEDI